MKEIFQIPIETDLKHPLPPSYCNSFLDDLKIRGGRRPRGAGGGMEGPTGGLAAVGVSKGVFRGGEGGQPLQNLNARPAALSCVAPSVFGSAPRLHAVPGRPKADFLTTRLAAPQGVGRTG